MGPVETLFSYFYSGSAPVSPSSEYLLHELSSIGLTLTHYSPVTVRDAYFFKYYESEPDSLLMEFSAPADDHILPCLYGPDPA